MPGLTLPPPAALPLLAVGEPLGVWRVRGALHAGDAGQWYRVAHARNPDEASVALVLQRSERAAGVMLRFADLAGDLGLLSHPAIAVPSDSGVTATGQPYLILAGRDGRPLLKAMPDLGLRARLALLVELCEALRYLHQQGWLLADIDPAMLWVDPQRRLQLMGLSLVRMPDPDDPFERGTGFGALPGYASPERLAGEPPSLASEVYGLGALLCVLVDGRLPTEIDDGSGEAAPVSGWPELAPLERLSLDALMHKASSPLAVRRHTTAEALADDLRGWLAGLGHSALRVDPLPGDSPAERAIRAALDAEARAPASAAPASAAAVGEPVVAARPSWWRWPWRRAGR